MFRHLFPIALTLACAPAAFAQQSAHVHGIAEINLAIEGDEVQIEFASPADSIVGFEYEPKSDAEHKAVKDAIALLRDPANLFEMPAGAGCEVHEVEAGRSGEGDHDDHHDEHDGHDDHAKHDEHDEHDEHDGHDDDHAKHDEHDEHDDHAKHDDHDDHGESEGATHSEFHAHYHFECSQTPTGVISLPLFKTWPKIETIRLQALLPGGQTGGNISADNPVIPLQ